MAWSPQARAAAIAARKAKAHGPKIAMNGHHGFSAKQTQPVNQAGHRGQQVKRFAKTAAKVGAATAVAAVAANVAYKKGVSVHVGKDQTRQTHSGKGHYYMGGPQTKTAYATVAHKKSGLHVGIEKSPNIANKRAYKSDTRKSINAAHKARGATRFSNRGYGGL
jgi:hypothetical protein